MAGISRRQLELLLRQTIEEDDLTNFLTNIGDAFEQTVISRNTAEQAEFVVGGMRRGLQRIEDTILGDHFPGIPQIDFTDARTQSALDTLTGYLGYTIEGHHALQADRQGEAGIADFLARGLDHVNPFLREVAQGGANIATNYGLNWANLQRIANQGGMIGGAVGGVLGGMRGIGHRVNRLSPVGQAVLLNFGISAMSSSMDYLYNKAYNYAFSAEDQQKLKEAQKELEPLHKLIRKEKGTERDVSKLTLLDQSGAKVSHEQLMPHVLKTVSFLMEQLRKQHDKNMNGYNVVAQLASMNDGSTQYNSVVL